MSDVMTVVAKEDKGEEPGPGPEPQELKLSLEPSTIYVDESTTFKVELDGNDVTVEATIYLSEGNVALDGATYTASAEGVYSFYAKYEERKQATCSGGEAYRDRGIGTHNQG